MMMGIMAGVEIKDSDKMLVIIYDESTNKFNFRSNGNLKVVDYKKFLEHALATIETHYVDIRIKDIQETLEREGRLE